MTAVRPRSLLSLILLGFGFVIVPLFVALGYAGVYVDRLSEQAHTTVYNAARAIQLSSNLDDSLTALERAARQHLVLDDEGLLEVYRNAHQQFRDNFNELRRFATTTTQRRLLSVLDEREQTLFDTLTAESAPAGLTQEVVTDRFIAMNQLAEAVSTRSNDVIDQEVRRMQSLGATAQRWLFWMGAALLPLTLISAGVFTVLISRPIRGIDQAIRRLGAARFDEPITVSGPQDLQALGARLDWLRNRLIELENEKTRFLRHVSHELKTPLTAIRESSQLLSEEVVGPLNDEQREIATILDDSGRQLQGLIEDLLDFSRTQSQLPQLRLGQVDLGEIAADVLGRHRAAIRARELHLDFRETAVPMRGDAEKLRTIVDNLLSNAIKFSPTGGRVRVTIEPDNEWVTLAVEDDGPGVPESERKRIFEAFYQGGNQPEGYVKGTGLGLSITREYALAHGGRIGIGDAGDDAGGRFSVILPLRGPAPQHARTALAAAGKE